MAGVYIKDLKVPEIHPGDYIELHLKGDGTTEFFLNAELTRREWTTVPDHGDLIDRSQLEEDGEWDENLGVPDRLPLI